MSVKSRPLFIYHYCLIRFPGMGSDDDDGGFEDLPYRIQVAYDATIGTYVCVIVCALSLYVCLLLSRHKT